MCHSCYEAWVRAGRPYRGQWEPHRRAWLQERTTLKCFVYDKLTTGTWLGMDMACYRAWVRAGRADLWKPETRSGFCAVLNHDPFQKSETLQQSDFPPWNRAEGRVSLSHEGFNVHGSPAGLCTPSGEFRLEVDWTHSEVEFRASERADDSPNQSHHAVSLSFG